MTVDRFGIQSIKDALVTLIGTTQSSALNNGLSVSVKQITTRKPDMGQAVIPSSMYPTVNIWSGRANMNLRGASKRYEMTMVYQIDLWTRDIASIDAAKDQLELLADNVLYILFNGIDSLGLTNGYIKPTSYVADYNTNESGFIAHGIIELEVYRALA
jgi:hypothetical protein